MTVLMPGPPIGARLPAPTGGGATPVRPVVDLDDAAARSADLVGRKAAALAHARAAGLPALPGLVVRHGQVTPSAWAAVESSATRLGDGPLIVRSSSPYEDGEDSSQAGRFLSVRDVDGTDALREAVDAVAASGDGLPVAVLVQPQQECRISGVLFGVDPVTGAHRPRVTVVEGSPERLVGGEQAGLDLTLPPFGGLRRDGRRVREAYGVPAGKLGRALRRLAADAEAIYGGPQDIEWGWTPEGRLVLFQARPVTRVAAAVARRAPVLGAGPVAETLPEPLWPLEEDLWVRPLDLGLTAALRTVGRRPPTPVIRSVRGRAVADLAALGQLPRRRLAVLDPRPAVRRLSAAWRVGQLRASLPGIAASTVEQVDRLLLEIPEPATLTDAQLVAALDRAGDTLVAVHQQEALIGIVLSGRAGEHGGQTAAGTAVRVLATLDRPPAEAVREEPVLLALVPPSIGPTSWPSAGPMAKRRSDPVPPAPPVPSSGDQMIDDSGPAEVDAGVLREALRLRARWLQELQARIARELGCRLVALGQLVDPLQVRRLRRSELTALLLDPTMPSPDTRGRAPDSTPLPASFRLAADGTVAASKAGAGGRQLSGTGAAGGRVSGTVVHDPAEIAMMPDGGSAVLVVEALTPSLAVHLPSLTALVAETGSPLSHLAILAREQGVAAVVGVPDARSRIEPGSQVVVDGRAGTIDVVAAAVDTEPRNEG
jgi:rifampicin phosphotransferase